MTNLRFKTVKIDQAVFEIFRLVFVQSLNFVKLTVSVSLVLKEDILRQLFFVLQNGFLTHKDNVSLLS